METTGSWMCKTGWKIIHGAWLSVVHFPNKEFLIMRSAEAATGWILLRIAINELDGYLWWALLLNLWLTASLGDVHVCVEQK